MTDDELLGRVLHRFILGRLEWVELVTTSKRDPGAHICHGCACGDFVVLDGMVDVSPAEAEVIRRLMLEKGRAPL